MSGSISRNHREAFQARLEFWKSRTLLKPSRVRFRYMTRFWAVCCCDNSITFSTALLDQPAAFQDLVIVHELVHLCIPDHSDYFWRVLELYQPDWRTIGRLAPESPVKRKQHYRVEDCPMPVDAKFPQGRIKITGMKQRVQLEEGAQLSTNCRQLKMPAPDGKLRLTDAATAQSLLRIVESIPSPKAEPIKLWLAKVGYRICHSRKRFGRSRTRVSQYSLDTTGSPEIRGFWEVALPVWTTASEGAGQWSHTGGMASRP
jgi:hypothetical protein